MKLRKIFVLFILFSFHLTTFTHAASPSGGGRWADKTVTRVGLDDIIEATARQQVTRNGSSVTLEAVVRKTVERQAVGKVLLSRLLAGGLLVGATQALLDGIGWVMEEGTYIKYKPDESNPNCNVQYYVTPPGLSRKSCTVMGATQFYCDEKIKDKTYASCTVTGFNGLYGLYKYAWKGSPDSIRESSVSVQKLTTDKPGEPKKITLTDELMGDIAVGDYTDPVDSSKDKKDRKWTGVEDAYKHHPDGTGNELSDALDDEMDNAPETPKKPTTAPSTDGEGQKYPTDKDKGTEGTTEQEKDPETGQPTGQGSFNLPAWCLWAADQCEWHKEDKKHQEAEKKVWEDEKKHRDDEGSFWKKITDFFADEDIDQEDPDEPDTSVLDREFDTTFSASGSCPPNVKIPFPPFGDLEIGGDKICSFFGYLRYGVLAACSFAAMLIVGAAVRGT